MDDLIGKEVSATVRGVVKSMLLSEGEWRYGIKTERGLASQALFHQ